MKRALLLVVCLGSFAAPCPAGAVVQSKGAATLEIRFDAPKAEIGLSDLITVELSVEGSAALRVEPSSNEAPAGWTLVERSSEKIDTIGPDRLRWRLIHRFAPRAPSANTPFSFPAFKYHDGKTSQEVAFDPVDFKVTTQIATPDLSQLVDITSIEPLPPLVHADYSWAWWYVAAAVLILAVAGVILGWYWRRRVVPRTPTMFALHELRRLVAMRLPQRGHAERFVTLLTTIVRRYLERQLQIPARRQTTAELVGHLTATSSLSAAEKQFLIPFFQKSDAFKFAQEPLTSEECSQLAEHTRYFLERRSGQADESLSAAKNA